MKKVLLFMAGLAISASAFAQDSEGAVLTDVGFGGSSSEVAVRKPGLKYTNITEDGNKWFAFFIENKDEAIAIADLQSIYVKWSGNTDTKNTAVYAVCKNEGDSKGVNHIWYLRSESGEQEFSVADITADTNTADKALMVGTTLRVSPSQSIIIDEFYITKTDGTKIYGHNLLSQLNNFGGIKYITTPCTFTFYSQYQGPVLTLPDGKNFEVSGSVPVDLTIEAGSNTYGRFFLKDVSGNTTIKTLANGTTTWAYSFAKGTSYSQIGLYANAVGSFGYTFPYTAEITSVKALVNYAGDISLADHTYTNGTGVEVSGEVPTDGCVYNIKISRTVTAGVWSTMVLPYTLTSELAAKFFGEGTEMAEFTSATGNTYNFTPVSSVEAGVPFLIKAAVQTTSFGSVDGIFTTPETVTKDGVSFTGYYYGTGVPKGSITLNNNGVPEDNNAELNTTKYGFRAYFTPADGVKAADITINVGDAETGVDSVVGSSDAPAEYFNIQGVRVSADALTPGLYIRRQGGKTTKVVIK